MNTKPDPKAARADATQELDAACVLEVIARDGSRVSGSAAANELVDETGWHRAARVVEPSASSIAPIGIDIAESRTESTRKLRIDDRRKRHLRIVLATIAGCGVVLLLALVRVALRSEDAASAKPALETTSVSPLAPILDRAVRAGERATAHASGTLRFDARLVKRRVLLDGNPVKDTRVTLGCGAHEITVGKGKPRTIDVPCGGELKVAR